MNKYQKKIFKSAKYLLKYDCDITLRKARHIMKYHYKYYNPTYED